MTQEVDGRWVTHTITVAYAACPDDANVQLSILTRALVRHGKMLGVSKDVLVENFERAYDAEDIRKITQ